MHTPYAAISVSSPHRQTGSLVRLGAVALAAWMATGCSVLQEDTVDYKSARQGNALEVPPDLTQLSRDPRYQVPQGVVSASNSLATPPVATGTVGGGAQATAISATGDVRIERSGNLRWLVINRPAEKIWVPVKDFWVENGFVLSQEQETLGVMETDWAENRAKIPQDFIRSTIGKVFEGLYSSGERDKFRTRLERNANGGTDIYISHRGMAEVYTNSTKDQTVWQARPTDAGLENEFLRRLMIKLGASEAQAQLALNNPAVQATSRITTTDGVPTLQLDDDVDRAWRRVGLALDRTGFTVEERDRTQGVYVVRYLPQSDASASKPGFLSRLFSRNESKAAPSQYRITVRAVGTTTTVAVLNAQGVADASPDAQRIVQLLANDLK